jgi:hypothetical protein
MYAMKTTKSFLMKYAAAALALLFVSTVLFAEGGTSEVYLSGTTNTAAGDYVVTGTDDVYHYQGKEYTVYNVYYDNPSHNMKIAVYDEENCKSFIAYSKGYWFMYNCSKEGFGVRKAMFASETIRDEFNAKAYQNQTVLVKSRKIEKEKAIGLIAAYLPLLHG